MAVLYPLERQLQLTLFYVTVIFSTLAAFTVGLRMLGRLKLGRRLDLSDYIMLGSLATMLGQAMSIVSAILRAGVGFHVSEIMERFGDTEAIREFFVLFTVARTMATLSLAMSKISILVLCCRIFTSKRFHLLANITNGLITVWAIGNILVDLKICNPASPHFDALTDQTCGPAIPIWIAAGTVNIFLDVVVLVLPMPYIYKVQLVTYKKVTLMVMFGIGFIVCVLSIVKVAIIDDVDQQDVTFSIQFGLLLAILETSVAIVVACIPVLRPIFRSSLAATRAAHMSRLGYGSGLGGLHNGGGSLSMGGAGGSKGFTELRTLIAGGKSGRNGRISEEHDEMDEEPLPMRPEKTYYSKVEAMAVGRSSEDVASRSPRSMKGRDVEMGGITVKTEFTASVEVVEVPDRATRTRQSVRSSLQHRKY